MDTRAKPWISVRPLREDELTEANRICREAFDTFTGIKNLFGDKDYLRTRWRAARHEEPVAAGLCTRAGLEDAECAAANVSGRDARQLLLAMGSVIASTPPPRG